MGPGARGPWVGPCGGALGWGPGVAFYDLGQEFSASLGKAFILAGGLGTGLSFYGV